MNREIIITTKMDKEDYHRFLYVATFLRNKWVLPLIAAFAFLGSLAVNLSSEGIYWRSVPLLWLILFAISILAICFKVESRNRKRIKTDRTGTFGTYSTLTFNEECVSMKSDQLHASGVLKYDQFHRLIESKHYFIFYINATQATLVRKVDMDNIDAFRIMMKEKFGKRYRKI